MNITVLSIDIKTIPTAKGSYQTADVAYKNNSFQGKVEGKKIMSFGATKSSFETLATAAPGTSWEVNIVKNDKGYNDWVSMTPAGAGAVNPVDPTSTATGGFAGKSTPAPKSNYETSEERAQRQILIVRQSSVSAAVNALTPGAKSPLKAKDIISLAKELEGYVFGKETFEDVPDFDPAAFPVAE